MDPVNYTLLLSGLGICLCALVGVFATRRIVKSKPLSVRLLTWLAAGVLCFGGSQIAGKGVIGSWPFMGPPDVYVRLVRVEVCRSSGKIAVVTFAGVRGHATQSAAKLFVADRDGKDIVEVCRGTVLDVRWASNGRQLYVLRSRAGDRKGSSKSLWRYTTSARKLARVRELPQRATALHLDPTGRRLLFQGPRAPETDGRFLLVEGQINSVEQDRAVCWREGWLGSHTWGPKTGSIFVATNEASSFGNNHGLWMIQFDSGSFSQPIAILEMQGIEGISLNRAETRAALFVRRWPPPCIDFDLYLLDVPARQAMPITPDVEFGSAVWDREGRTLVFADGDGLKTYTIASGRLRLLVEAPPSQLNPGRRERLKPLDCDSSGDIVFQAGLWRIEKYISRTGDTRTLFHMGQLRRYFKG